MTDRGPVGPEHVFTRGRVGEVQSAYEGKCAFMTQHQGRAADPRGGRPCSIRWLGGRTLAHRSVPGGGDALDTRSHSQDI